MKNNKKKYRLVKVNEKFGDIDTVRYDLEERILWWWRLYFSFSNIHEAKTHLNYLNRRITKEIIE